MRSGTRALVELTSLLTQRLWELFTLVPAGPKYGDKLVELNGREIDPSFVWSDIYALRFWPQRGSVANVSVHAPTHHR